MAIIAHIYVSYVYDCILTYESIYSFLYQTIVLYISNKHKHVHHYKTFYLVLKLARSGEILPRVQVELDLVLYSDSLKLDLLVSKTGSFGF